jgi:hypothetical protein
MFLILTRLVQISLNEYLIHFNFIYFKGINGSFSLFLLKDGFNSSEFEVIPKIALNDANLIIKVKNPTDLINKMGTIERYDVSFKTFFKL